jgi:hypothetical protein
MKQIIIVSLLIVFAIGFFSVPHVFAETDNDTVLFTDPDGFYTIELPNDKWWESQDKAKQSWVLYSPNGESIIRIISYGGADQNLTDRDILNEIQQKNHWYCSNQVYNDIIFEWAGCYKFQKLDKEITYTNEGRKLQMMDMIYTTNAKIYSIAARLFDGYNYFEITSRTTIDGSKADPETLQQIKEIIKSIVLLDPYSIYVPNQTQAMIMASDLGVTESDIINNNIDFWQFKNHKKYQNTENNFSIEYPAEFVVVEDYDSAHGTTGHVRFHPESLTEPNFYLSVFGKIVNLETAKEGVLEHHLLNAKNWFGTGDNEMKNIKKFTKEVNGLKHNIIEFDEVDSTDTPFSTPYVYHHMNSWVIVEDEVWEINSYTSVTEIAVVLASAFPDITSQMDSKEISELVSESSTLGLQRSIESFEIKKTVSVPAPVTSMPDWIKNNAGWWANGQIDDASFLQGISYLIQNNIIVVSPTDAGSESSGAIPDWVKNNAGWWATDRIGDESFVNAITYLIQQGLIQV